MPLPIKTKNQSLADLAKPEQGLIPLQDMISDTASNGLQRLGVSPTISNMGGIGADLISGLAATSLTNKAIKAAKEIPTYIRANTPGASINYVPKIPQKTVGVQHAVESDIHDYIMNNAEDPNHITAVRDRMQQLQAQEDHPYSEGHVVDLASMDDAEIAKIAARNKAKNEDLQKQSEIPVSEGHLYNPMMEEQKAIAAVRARLSQSPQVSPSDNIPPTQTMQ